MAKLQILTLGNPILKKKAKALKKVTPEIKKLVKGMAEKMYESHGVGLAAPQVGKSIRLVIVDVGEGLVAFINPKITKKSGTQEMMEGCLSLPGLRAPVERAEQITVKSLDQDRKYVTLEAHGLFSQVIQHEIDHLDGILCTDRVKDPSLIVYEPPEIFTKESNL